MPEYLQQNQVAVAINRSATIRVLEPILDDISGSEPVFDVSGAGVRFRLDIDYDVYNVEVDIQSPHIKLEPLDIDTTFRFRLDIDFNTLYDAIRSIFPLPPRCWKVCIPFTNICYEKCFDLGSASITIPVPISFSLWCACKPVVDEKDGKYFVYPQIDVFSPLIFDIPRIIERICHALAAELPWPLNLAAGALCRLFGRIFGFLYDKLNELLFNLGLLMFDATGGWVGIQLKDAKLFELDRHKLPGASNPEIPILLQGMAAKVNTSHEVDVRVKLLPAP